MKIIVTGSLGHISKPLTQKLVKQGHTVKIISSNPGKQPEIETLGASAALGTLENLAFLSHTFTGADLVYCMIPPGNYFDPGFDIMAQYTQIGNNYAQAIRNAGIKRVIHLSSIGGNMSQDNGMLVFHHKVENTFKELPEDVSVTTMRPTAFYYNLQAFLHLIKSQGFIASNYGDEDQCPWVSPLDIASAIAEEINNPFQGRKIRYVASEELSCNEIAGILGAAIGKPDLKWLTISDAQMLDQLKTAGMNPSFAQGLVDMNRSIHNGRLLEDYYRNRPIPGKTKMKDFASEFAAAYNQL